METKDRRAAFNAWISARLNRAKRVMPFNRLWRREKKARVLPTDEATKELARHHRLIEQLASETLQTKESEG